MGGSFNPVHERHMEIAKRALAEQALDRVVFLPTGNPPHKREGLAGAEDRYEMTRLMVLGEPSMSASRAEIDREGVTTFTDLSNSTSPNTPLNDANNDMSKQFNDSGLFMVKVMTPSSMSLKRDSLPPMISALQTSILFHASVEEMIKGTPQQSKLPLASTCRGSISGK